MKWILAQLLGYLPATCFCMMVLTLSTITVSCRSINRQSSNAKMSSAVKEFDRNSIPEPIAKDCYFKKNEVEIPRFCHATYSSQRYRSCVEGHQPNSVILLSCRDGSHPGVDLASTSLRFAQIARSDFSEADITQTDFLASHGDWSKFHKVQGNQSVFSFAVMIGSEFHDASLRYAEFVDTTLLQAQFDRADLTGALFHSANLRKATFNNSQLKGASFVLADLQDASFVGANLLGADFNNADLDGTDFTGALHLDKTLGLPEEVRQKFSQ
ncbi:MAG: pentapeptide repeat-containing protein [Proteobacteria bacterium]|nr:pentapeptide repeat-containing protein [Pseudomonadota bacterium]